MAGMHPTNYLFTSLGETYFFVLAVLFGVAVFLGDDAVSFTEEALLVAVLCEDKRSKTPPPVALSVGSFGVGVVDLPGKGKVEARLLGEVSEGVVDLAREERLGVGEAPGMLFFSPDGGFSDARLEAGEAPGVLSFSAGFRDADRSEVGVFIDADLLIEVSELVGFTLSDLLVDLGVPYKREYTSPDFSFSFLEAVWLCVGDFIVCVSVAESFFFRTMGCVTPYPLLLPL